MKPHLKMCLTPLRLEILLEVWSEFNMKAPTLRCVLTLTTGSIDRSLVRIWHESLHFETCFKPLPLEVLLEV